MEWMSGGVSMEGESFHRKLAAILSADVEGYSLLMSEDEAETVRSLTSSREVMASFIEQFRGRVVDAPGDNLLAEFSSVVDAVQCAVEIQRVFKARNAQLPKNRQMKYRIGINLGDVITEGDRIYGDGVNIAARIEALADGGGICLSGSAYEQIENKLPLDYQYLGEHAVKNIPKPVRVYRAEIEAEGRWRAKREKGPPVSPVSTQQTTKSDKKRLAALILCGAFGVFGAHRFYVGKTGTAIIQLLTIGGLGIWMVIDFILIIFGDFSDREGKKLLDWT
jgi:class 3 adenylate cyclase